MAKARRGDSLKSPPPVFSGWALTDAAPPDVALPTPQGWLAPPWALREYLVAGEVRAWIGCDQRPRPQGNSKRIIYVAGFPKLKPSKSEERYRDRLVAWLALHAPPCVPFSVPVQLDLMVDLPPPAGWTAGMRAQALTGDPRLAPHRGIPGCGHIPDRGNLLKMAEDALQMAGWIVDDSLTLDGRLGKRWSLAPGYHLRIRPLVPSQGTAQPPSR